MPREGRLETEARTRKITGRFRDGLLIRMGVLLSSLLYAFGLVAAVAALALIRPISWLGLRTRRRAVVTWLLAIAGGVGTLARRC